MTSFDENETEFEQYDDGEGQGDGLIRIQWRQGDAKQGTGGYFYLGSANVPEGFTPGAPWVAHQEYFKNSRTREPGWKAEALPMYIICARGQTYKKDGAGGVGEWLESWPKGGASNEYGQHADVLLVADGLEELGPVCWSTNSTTTAFAILGGADPKRNPKGGILHRIREEVLGAADAVSKKLTDRKKKKLYWLFKVTVSTETDAKGATVYTATKSGTDITRPVPVLPAKVDATWLGDAYVGPEVAQYGRDLRAQYETWRATRKTNDAPVAAAARPGGRNVPQAIEDDKDLPF